MSIAANFHAKAQQRQQVTQEEVTRIAIRLLTNQNAHTERTATNFQMTEKRDSIGNVILFSPLRLFPTSFNTTLFCVQF